MTRPCRWVDGALVSAWLLVLAACTGGATPPPTSPAVETTTSVATAATSEPPPTTTTTTAPPAEHRIQVRVVDGEGEFYDTATGERFVPRGMNYNRFLPGRGGVGRYGMLLAAISYDPDTVEEDLAAMAAMGFNVVRILLEICGPARNGCVAGSDGLLNPNYMDNLADFLARAKAHDMFVMIGSNTLPDDSYWLNTTYSFTNSTFAESNNEFLNPKAMPVYVDYWRSLVQALVDRGAPLDAIWAYELRQELHFFSNAPPLSLEEGLVTTANGETYDMADPDDKNRMVDEGLTFWADTIRTAIREIDPTALVTVGFFVPNAPNPIMAPDDPRLVRTAYFLRNSTVDFVDLHHYSGNGVDDAEVWENFGIEGVDEKPLVLGEYGAFRDWFPDEARAATAVMDMEVQSCRVGFDGWIVWSWRGDIATDIWWASERKGLIAQVVSPLERPDPCAYGEFDFLVWNVATTASVSASSFYEGAPLVNVIDGTPELWNAAGAAPQWIELALAAPRNVDIFRLTVAQDPPGASVHELWVRRTGGDLERIYIFDGVTREGDVLIYEPPEPLTNVEVVRVVTRRIAGDLAPAWREIELITRSNPD